MRLFCTTVARINFPMVMVIVAVIAGIVVGGVTICGTGSCRLKGTFMFVTVIVTVLGMVCIGSDSIDGRIAALVTSVVVCLESVCDEVVVRK